jgi:hypothetical protein
MIAPRVRIRQELMPASPVITNSPFAHLLICTFAHRPTVPSIIPAVHPFLQFKSFQVQFIQLSLMKSFPSAYWDFIVHRG